MLVLFDRAEFNTISYPDLLWKCIEPVIRQIQGKDIEVKSGVYRELTEGQRALLMFWIVYGHARHGIRQFYLEVRYLLEKEELLMQLNTGIRYFGLHEMALLFNDIERIYRQVSSKQGINLEADTRLSREIDSIDNKFSRLIPNAINTIGRYIKSNPEMYVFMVN
jgi:hypothetical protein